MARYKYQSLFDTSNLMSKIPSFIDFELAKISGDF